MTIDHVALADYGDRIATATREGDYPGADPLVGRITRDDMRPYRDRVIRWLADDATSIARLRSVTHIALPNLDGMMNSPTSRTRSMPVFFSWLRRTGQAPFAAVPSPVFATVAQIGTPEATAEMMEPWRKTIIRWVGEVGPEAAILDPTSWATGTVESGPHSTLDRFIRQSWDMLSTAPAFRRWLESHGQTAPDPVAEAVPSGDGVIPIGPEHPGWAAFWERARSVAGGGTRGRYEAYWQVLAREFGYLAPRQRRTVRVTIDYQIDAEAETPDTDTISVAERTMRDYGFRAVPGLSVIATRADIR